ncbi:LDCC motif putative metal-binding protein [Clostridium oceanicum]|uniref:Uncharacterized protein n=1 Tax=Clostridium oceanicum TaxID=1543 RepID=A0ABN1JHZ2_9CLOT
MKKIIGKFLKKLEKTNESTFGNKKLDCCDLNKSSDKDGKNKK